MYRESAKNLVFEDACKYIIADLNQLNELLKGCVCKECQLDTLEIGVTSEKQGFVQQLYVHCKNCDIMGLEPVKSKAYTSKRIKVEAKKAPFDLNIRMPKAFIYNGMGYTNVQKMAMFLNICIPSEDSFMDSQNYIHKACQILVNKCLQRARSLTKKHYNDLSLDNDEATNEFTESTVSYDGSWLTRGHRSKHGLACAIDSTFGYVLDMEVLSKYCHACEIAKKDYGEGTPEFAVWLETHVSECCINHTESSGAMERNAAEIIWKRSEAYVIRFMNMISDGDCSTFSNLSNFDVYGPDKKVQKLECVNHVQKRYI